MESISMIKEKLQNEPIENILEAIKEYENDSRKGVIKLVESALKRHSDFLAEKERIFNLSQYERKCYEAGYELVAGIDEVGRGPLAGPVVTAVVILPKDCEILGINDSKKLSQAKREELYTIIIEKAIDYSIGIVSPKEIDEINILQATYKAMEKAIDGLKIKPDYILVDAVTIPNIEIEQHGIIKGDAKSISIGAASIVAKVTRDKMMEEYSKIYPEFDFESNKGYGSKSHIDAIKEVGICPIHRRSFVKNFV